MVKIIVGMMGSSVAKGAVALSSEAGVKEFLSVAESHGIRELDTARVYAGGQSEKMLGSVDASKTFTIATKAPAFSPGSLASVNIIKNCDLSLDALRVRQIDMYYLHGPDKATPLAEQCLAIGQLYKEGKFQRFGVSNISDQEVQDIYNICKQEGYPLPEVYQGGYNPLQRGSEATLFPLLRRLGMSFYAFSPLAGGLLAKPVSELLTPKSGTRFEQMKVFGDIYLTPPILAALAKVQKACDDAGLTLMEATLRWFVHHSPLEQEDGFILGASSPAQIDASLTATEQGPLPLSILRSWEDLHMELKNDSR